MKKLLPVVLAFVIVACSSSREEADTWNGEWRAIWETDPASFAGIDGITSFAMNGKLTFAAEKVTIEAYGHKGCAFGEDTLNHTLFWEVKNDSLILTNSEDTPGMDYRIKSKADKKIELQLLEDIYLTLER